MEGVDFSSARPSGICLWHAGKRFVVRYFGPGGAWKHATPREIAAYQAVGLGVVANAEGAARDPLHGRPEGRLHATEALNAAMDCGMPNGAPIYFSIDFDAQPHDMGAVANYLRGCADELGYGRVGVYGSYAVVEYARAQRLARYLWQTYAWSNGRWSPHAHLQQYRNRVIVCGGEVDLNRAMFVDYGQWGAPTQSVGQAPPPPVESTIDTGWDFTPHVDSLAGAMAGLATSLTSYAGATDALGDG